MRSIRRGLLILSLSLMSLPGCSPQRVIEAVVVLRAIGEIPNPDSHREQPERQAVTFGIDGRQHEGDLYLSHDPPKAAVIVIPGVAPAGRQDPRLVAFAGILARAQFEVLVPDVEGMREATVSAADARIFADAIVSMAERDPERPLGMAALSFAVGPAVLALFEPGVAPRTDFILAIGGYHDLKQALIYFTTGYYRPRSDEPWRHRPLNGSAKWAFVHANAGRIEDRRDQELLKRLAERKIDDPAADVRGLIERLGPDGKSVYALMTNQNPERVSELIEALPDRVRHEIQALDLNRRPVGTLDVEFILIHGRDDPVIPFTQSVALAEVVGYDQARLYLIDTLDHVDLQTPGLWDGLRLIQATYRLLSIRDSG